MIDLTKLSPGRAYMRYGDAKPFRSRSKSQTSLSIRSALARDYLALMPRETHKVHVK